MTLSPCACCRRLCSWQLGGWLSPYAKLLLTEMRAIDNEARMALHAAQLRYESSVREQALRRQMAERLEAAVELRVSQRLEAAMAKRLSAATAATEAARPATAVGAATVAGTVQTQAQAMQAQAQTVQTVRTQSEASARGSASGGGGGGGGGGGPSDSSRRHELYSNLAVALVGITALLFPPSAAFPALAPTSGLLSAFGCGLLSPLGGAACGVIAKLGALAHSAPTVLAALGAYRLAQRPLARMGDAMRRGVRTAADAVRGLVQLSAPPAEA